jgi:adenosine deaminase
LHITTHAGEWNGPASVREALEKLGAERIGHGVRVVEDAALLKRVIEQAIVLEICPTSNLHSGVVESFKTHPLRRLFDAGVKTTINTDDPLISNITLTDEYVVAVKHFGFTIDEIKQQILTAAEGSFLKPDAREKLVTQFRGWLEESETIN